jgi:hypothetical protein
VRDGESNQAESLQPTLGNDQASHVTEPPIGTRSNEAAQQMPPHYAPRVQRVNVNFSEQAYQTLQQLSVRTGKSMSDVLRDAIALKAWFEQTRAEGGHVLVEHPDGKVREVISV